MITTTFLILFLNTILCSTSGAKVLPVIEGSELLDTLSTQNNEDLSNLPELTAGIHKYTGLENLNTSDKYLTVKLFLKSKPLCCYPLLHNSFCSVFIPKSNFKIDFHNKILIRYFHKNI